MAKARVDMGDQWSSRHSKRRSRGVGEAGCEHGDQRLSNHGRLCRHTWYVGETGELIRVDMREGWLQVTQIDVPGLSVQTSACGEAKRLG
jgi:hypothetical protein